MAAAPANRIQMSGYEAFLPPPLPPKFEWTPRLVQIGRASCRERVC